MADAVMMRSDVVRDVKVVDATRDPCAHRIRSPCGSGRPRMLAQYEKVAIRRRHDGSVPDRPPSTENPARQERAWTLVSMPIDMKASDEFSGPGLLLTGEQSDLFRRPVGPFLDEEDAPCAPLDDSGSNEATGSTRTDDDHVVVPRDVPVEAQQRAPGHHAMDTVYGARGLNCVLDIFTRLRPRCHGF